MELRGLAVLFTLVCCVVGLQYNLYDPEPKCLKENLCPKSDYSNYEERMMITRLNSLRFDPTLHITRNYDDDKICSAARTRGKLANIDPLFWRSDLSQAAKFHSWEMATSSTGCFQKDTCKENCHLFGDDCSFAARIRKYHDDARRLWVGQIIGQGDADSVLNEWIRDESSCQVLFSPSSDTVGVGLWKAEDGKQYWTAIFSEAQPEHSSVSKMGIIAGSHVHTDDKSKVQFLVFFSDKVTGEGLREFAAVVDGNFHHLTRHRGGSAKASIIGKTGLYEDFVPTPDEDHCHYYYFQFRTHHSGTAYRLPEQGVYWTNGVGECEEQWTQLNPHVQPTVKYITPEEDYHPEHRPGYQRPYSWSEHWAEICLVVVVVFGILRYRRRILRFIIEIPEALRNATRRGPRMRP